MPTLADRLHHIHERIAQATSQVSRDPSSVRLMLATKTQDMEILRRAFALGESLYGENRVQELVPKCDALKDLPITWQFIGHLQTNKVRDVIGRVSCIQSIDRPSLVEAVDAECKKRGTVVDVMIEVNTSGEESKHGAPAHTVQKVIDDVLARSTMRITGFMTIGALSEDEVVVRRCFESLRLIRDEFDAHHGTTSHLSMGMSDDLEWAVAEGSTMVRVGTAVFGERL
ncbi:MAG: YggS family pyridoxal phosphate-dependent enzyme [Ignavibacteria bacterium]|nr:YggS family pyridoxal phosphate-dependent enzyme [Ignavibacteria bacterium]MBK9181878.1 YggS family pyridoxal phosphate-dependent enzyme [Ignavibacteria bacterium]